MSGPLAWLRRASTSILPVALMGGFLLVSLWLLTAATENSAQFGRLHLWLVILNILGLVILLGLIAASLLRLVRQYRRGATGSRLTARLVLIFVVMAVVPVSIVFYFSLGFVERGVDSWFDVRIDRAMDEALQLSKSALDMRMREHLRQTREIAHDLGNTEEPLLVFRLNELRQQVGASELVLAGPNGRVIASSSGDTHSIIPNLPDDIVLQQVRENGTYVALAPIEGSGLHARVAVRLPGKQPRLLVALYPFPERIGTMADDVQSAYSKYKELVYLREPLKQTFSFTLSLVLLVSLFSAVWAAFYFAQRLVSPIRILAIGTRAVAAGNYQKRLPVTSNDELGSLVQSFSDMTHRISAAQQEAQRSRRQVERERAYLRAVLGRLSSGVLTLDRDLTLRAVNAAASQILDTNLEQSTGRGLPHLEQEHPALAPFFQTLRPHLERAESEWHEEISLNRSSGHRLLAAHGSHLPEVEGIPAGFVVVFEDVTELVQAQRDAAWGEVARRLAHEIKNPLTPIQLSAERLRRRYLQRMEPADAEVLDRATHTIVQQVQALQEMVQAFSEYARTPRLALCELQLGQLVDEVLDLYRDNDAHVSFILQQQAGLPAVKADPGRLRQLLHNLLRNAIDSLSGRPEGRIAISLHRHRDSVEMAIEDNGPGIPPEIFDKLFEPYATTKPRGTGLGLAVVKRIVEEHMGSLYAENTAHGARLVVRLPAVVQAGQSADEMRAASSQ